MGWGGRPPRPPRSPFRLRRSKPWRRRRTVPATFRRLWPRTAACATFRAEAFGMRWLAAFAMSVSLLLAQAGREPERSVTAVRHWSLSDATRVAVQVSGDFAFRTGRLHNPERVYFDILNARPRVDSRPGYTEVRHWSLSDATRVAVQVSGDFAFRTGRLHNPERVYFDILNARPRVDSRPGYTEVLEDRLLKRIRVAQKEPGVTRVVLDLAEATDVSASRL